MAQLGGYMGRILRVDLTEEIITEETPDEVTLKSFVGGTGLGAKIMYDEVPAGVEWSDPANRLIWLTGPLSGTKAPGSGLYTVVTKGPLTNLFTATHANGFFGARLKFAGYDAVIFQGEAKRWVYLHIHNGVAELRNASHLSGKDAWETEELLKEEVKEKRASVSCIGPAGENLVKYACICSDKGHIASTNGCGAVMGSKKLKAIVVHGEASVPIKNKQRFTAAVKEWWEQADMTMWGMLIPSLGTNSQFSFTHELGILAIKNLTAHTFPDYHKFNADNLREYYGGGKKRGCSGCKWSHCREFELKSGPHKGKIVEEPEWEPTEAFSSQIGNSDIDAAMWLSHVNDRLGMDAKEQAFVMGLVMECYEKGLITKEDTDGLDLTWGNVEAVEILLNRIAKREGFGDVLAEGVMRTAQKIGGDALNFAVYTHKGNAPHVQDGRGMWSIIFSMAVSDTGSIPAGDMGDVGDMLDTLGANALDPSQCFSDEMVSKGQAITARRGFFIDSLATCAFVSGIQFSHIAETLNAVTGWDFTWKDCANVGERIMNVMRAFNNKHGMTREHNTVSPRLLEAPREGPAKGVSIAPKFDQMVDWYYESLGWDMAGRPLAETLQRLGLESISKDTWRTDE